MKYEYAIQILEIEIKRMNRLTYSNSTAEYVNPYIIAEDIKELEQAIELLKENK